MSNFKSTGTAPRAVPVEYKRGKPKAHRADEVQLCAQALCLEEMLGIRIECGALYYGEKRRRTEVVFDEALRELVRITTGEVRACFASGRTPLAEYDARRCDNCSLIDQCQPLAMRFKKGAAAWFFSNLKSEISNLKSTAEGCSRQIRGWADSLQNSEIEGQRHLNDRSREEWRKGEDAKKSRSRFDAMTREGMKAFPPDHPLRMEWERKNGPL